MILFCSAECKSSIDSRFLGESLDRLLFSVQPTLLKSRSHWAEVAGYIYPESTLAQSFPIKSFHPDLTCRSGWQSAGQVRVQVILSNSVFYLGSNLGKFDLKQSSDFLGQLWKCLLPGDYLLLGLDLLKSDHLLIPAYSDSQGLSAEFNLNMIRRLNKDFEMQWNPSDFEHYTTYNTQSLSMESDLVSRKEQKFKTVILAANEMIHTEVSRKYRLEDMQSMTESAGFQLVMNFLDNEQFFVDTIWKVLYH